VDLLLTILLVIVGLLLLLMTLAGVAFGIFMALDVRTREQGVLLAAWCVPAVAAALGVVLRDWVTFTIGTLCFVVAGAALALEKRSSKRRPPDKARRPGTTQQASKKRPPYSRTKRSLLDRILDRIKEYRKTVSS
jgi:hypothetical protein